MDDISGIKVLAGIVDALKDKNGSGKLLDRLAAHESAAAQSLAEAKATLEKNQQLVSQYRELRDDSARLRDEMLTKLTPRETEVANGAKTLQQWRVDLDAKEKDVVTRETELTRRENAAAAREHKIAEDEQALKTEKERVATMKAAYETKLNNIRKAATG